MNQEWQTLFLAMLPIGELRVSLPLAITVYRLNWVLAYFISVCGNLIPVLFLLKFLEPISLWLSRNFQIFQRFFSWLFKRTREKYNFLMKKYGWLALMSFVAIPFPLTGAWTAAIVAFLFNIPFKTAFFAIALGVMVAGGIVLSFTQAGIAIEKYFGWSGLLFTFFLLIFFYLLIHFLKIEKDGGGP